MTFMTAPEKNSRHWNPVIILFISIVSFSANAYGQEENLKVFDQWIARNNGGSALIQHLLSEASTLYEKRDREIAALATKDDWLKRQDTVRKKLQKIVGPFPEKTALNPRVTGIVHKDGYRVEKLVFESMPGLYVIGCIFVPDGIEGKRPAILDLMGHYQDSFRSEAPQKLILNLVKKGFIVLTIDPPGQGENVQNYDPAIEFSSVGYSVIEHCYFGNQCFLSGVSPARYFIWDAVRSIDYLVSRNDVDPERIGVTGFSGGGTITSYVAAFDDRVAVSVPSAWATAQRRELETKGAQDAETEFYHGVLEGITLEDLLEVRAPKPALMVCTSRDQYISIQGVHEAYEEAMKAYRAFGSENMLQITEDDSTHSFTKKNNEALYAFFQKHLDLPGDPAEEKVGILTAEELQVTPTGQISTFLNGKFIFDINRKETLALLEDLEQSRKNGRDHLSKVKQKARELSGFVEPDDDVKPFFQGRYRRNGYFVSKYAVEGEGNYAVPMLVFTPDGNRRNRVLLYIHPDGKESEALPGGEMELLAKEGFIVVAPDLPGTGELKNTATRDLADDYTAILIGRSIVGIQAGDIIRVRNFAESLHHTGQSNICAVARGDMCPALLHAAAFDPSLDRIALFDPLISYRSIAMNRNYRVGLLPRPNGDTNHPYEIDFRSCVAGALTAYDLPDLIACIAPSKVALSGVRDQMLEPASDELIQTELAYPLEVSGESGTLTILPAAAPLTEIADWCSH